MTHFNIIGIRPLMPKPLEENPVRADKMQAIQKHCGIRMFGTIFTKVTPSQMIILLWT